MILSWYLGTWLARCLIIRGLTCFSGLVSLWSIFILKLFFLSALFPSCANDAFSLLQMMCFSLTTGVVTDRSQGPEAGGAWVWPQNCDPGTHSLQWEWRAGCQLSVWGILVLIDGPFTIVCFWGKSWLRSLLQKRKALTFCNKNCWGASDNSCMLNYSESICLLSVACSIIENELPTVTCLIELYAPVDLCCAGKIPCHHCIYFGGQNIWFQTLIMKNYEPQWW